MLSKLRTAVQPLRRFLAWPFLKVGASPAMIGGLGIALAGGAAAAARLGWNVIAFWLAVLSLATDMADGEVARRTESCSPEGNYLDAVGDRVSECLLLLGLLPAAPNLVALALAGGCLTSFAKARCALVTTMDNSDWPGFGDYPDRAVIILVAYASMPQPAIPLVLLVITTWNCLWQRVGHGRQLIRGANPDELQPYLRGGARIDTNGKSR